MDLFNKLIVKEVPVILEMICFLHNFIDSNLCDEEHLGFTLKIECSHFFFTSLICLPSLFQRNFVESMAGYSLVCYLLQVCSLLLTGALPV